MQESFVITSLVEIADKKSAAAAAAHEIEPLKEEIDMHSGCHYEHRLYMSLAI
jgi:hypothetical protein